MYPPSFPSGAEVTLGMQCATIPSLVGDWSWGNGTGSPVNGSLTTGSSKACGLTGIGGIFNTGSTSDGIEVVPSFGVWGWQISPCVDGGEFPSRSDGRHRSRSRYIAVEPPSRSGALAA
jgi:hypothetical protein